MTAVSARRRLLEAGRLMIGAALGTSVVVSPMAIAQLPTSSSLPAISTIPLRPARAGVPRFDPRPCPDDLVIPSALDQTSVSCGSVTVPQNRADPTAKLAPIVLPVVVYAAATARNRTPLIFLAGGPGESAIEVVSQVFLTTPAGQVIMRERPVIAFNQRGFGDDSSSTNPTLGPLIYRPRATRVESVKSISDSARLIAKRLRARGIDPQFFTTLNAVDDIKDVADALGYEKIVLFGSSYGTRIALQFMRRHGDMVEAAILDGVAPPSDTTVFS